MDASDLNRRVHGRDEVDCHEHAKETDHYREFERSKPTTRLHTNQFVVGFYDF